MSLKKVLLVDDVQLILELEKTFLKGLPVDVIEAHNGAEAIDLVHKEHPDLIYLDLNMPIMDGPTCCRILKGDPQTKGIPVIMVTTAGKLEDELQCRSAGCDDYITKPINGKLFLDKGRQCIADFERRKRRYSFTTDVEFLKGGESHFGVTADISRGGLYIAVPTSNIPEDPVDLAFKLPLGGNHILVAARGRVAWQNRSDNPVKPNYPAGVGIEFIDIDPEIVKQLEHFFEEALKGK